MHHKYFLKWKRIVVSNSNHFKKCLKVGNNIFYSSENLKFTFSQHTFRHLQSRFKNPTDFYSPLVISLFCEHFKIEVVPFGSVPFRRLVIVSTPLGVGGGGLWQKRHWLGLKPNKGSTTGTTRQWPTVNSQPSGSTHSSTHLLTLGQEETSSPSQHHHHHRHSHHIITIIISIITIEIGIIRSMDKRQRSTSMCARGAKSCS